MEIYENWRWWWCRIWCDASMICSYIAAGTCVWKRERERETLAKGAAVWSQSRDSKLDKALTDITSRLEMIIKERRRKAKYKPFCKHDSKSSHQPPCTNFKKKKKKIMKNEREKILTWKHLPTLHLLSLFVDFFFISLMYLFFCEIFLWFNSFQNWRPQWQDSRYIF